jgi:oxygen-dependent protoporphyrinogen oxidase
MGPIAEMERTHGSLARATAARRRSGEDSVERNSTGARYGNFRAFRGGMIGLIRLLADSLPQNAIRLNAPVQSLVRGRDHWELTHSGNQTDTFDHVVVATPPRHAAKLLADVSPSAAAGLAAIESASAAIVVLGVRTADIAADVNTFGFVVPATENRRILAGSFASHKFAGRAPAGHTLVRVFVGGAMQSELLDQDDNAIVQLVREELADLIGLSGEPIITRVVRWNDAMPQYHVGHAARVQQIESAIAGVPQLTLMNNGLNGVGIAPVISSAGKIQLQVV